MTYITLLQVNRLNNIKKYSVFSRGSSSWVLLILIIKALKLFKVLFSSALLLELLCLVKY